MRSGNHAIIHWFINNVVDKLDHNNATYCYKKDQLIFYNDVFRRKNKHLPNELLDDNVILKDLPIKMMSCEESYHSLIDDHLQYMKLDNLDINDETIYNVFIFRDILNTFSSRKRKFGDSQITSNTVKNYKSLYDNYLKSKGQNTICITYNDWLTSKAKRDEFMKFFGFNNDKDNMDFVPSQGGGSSFIGRRKDKDENYLNRFSEIKITDNEKNQLLQREIIDIEKHLFNHDITETLNK